MSYLRGVILCNLFVLFSFPVLATDNSAINLNNQIESEHSKQITLELLNTLQDHFSNVLENVNPYPEVVQLILAFGKRLGTGFFISPDTLVTAYHVAENGPLYFIDSSTGHPVFTKVLRADRYNDLALLQAVNYESEHFFPIDPLNEENIDPIKEMTYEQPETEETITIPGFPHSSFSIVEGNIPPIDESIPASLRSLFSTLVRVTYKTNRAISTFNGLSGAPVLFKGTDQLMGVAVKGNRPGAPEFIVFTPVESLRNLVKGIDRGEEMLPLETLRIIEFLIKHENTLNKHKYIKFFILKPY